MIYGNSRYLSSNTATDETYGLNYLTERTFLSFDDKDCTFYTVIEGDTLDGIAYKMYGDASLWWVILDANPVYESEMDIVEGAIIAVPSKTVVENSL